jgi:hypothetical protein
MHQPVLALARDITPETVRDALRGHIGAANGISAAALAETITGRQSACDERRLRQCVEQLRNEGHAICAHPSIGYFIAATAAELNGTCVFLVERAMTSLRQVSRLKNRALPDLYGQLGLPPPGETK